MPLPLISARTVFTTMVALLLLGWERESVGAGAAAGQRRPENDGELRFWLQNMVWYHRFTPEEIEAAIGLTPAETGAALNRLGIAESNRPARGTNAPLLVLPYPGGRHPRIGFLDGAIDPQRDTKFSVFLPWDESSYVVVDAPEALWSNLGLTYLAHTHIPTIFDRQKVSLAPQEWTRRAEGVLDAARRLPNGISFRTIVQPGRDAVRMEMWLTNGTDQVLTGLRVQNCVMLKGAAGFNAQANANKVLAKPFVACRSESGDRWIITAWEPCDRPWANPPVPCLHSDPKFPDCPPGESRRLRGWLSFYTGTNVHEEFARIGRTAW
jgi:hypothetical protein